MRQRVFARLLTVLCALHLCAAAAFAQFDSATVLGFISDQTGAAMPGVTVTLTNPATGISTTAVSDERGQYQFLNVRIGTYSLKAELQGFTTAIAENFTVAVNARQRVDLALSVGGVGETVQVTGAARLLESESSDRGTVISREQIVNLPLNGRAYADLALLSPGVRKSSISTSRDASFNVNGLRSALNNFILDGVDNNSYGTSNQGFSNQVVQVSPDAVEEFKVQTNNFSAEFGRAGGAVINATFRSGTNQFRGAAWEFNRNTKLNATGFFKPSSGVKPEMNRNQFGGVFGGPIVRDRAFFFFNYEGFREVLQAAHVRQHPDDGAAAGQHGQAGSQPADRRVVCRWRGAAGGDHRLRAGRCSPGCPRRRGRHLEQLRLAAAPRGLQRQVRHQVRPAAQRGDDRVLPLQPSQGEQLRAAARSRARRAGRRTTTSRSSTSSTPAASRACCRPTRCSRSASACRGPRPARPRSAPAGRTCSRRMASPACRPTRVLRRPDAAVGERLDRVGPPEQQPAVSEPARHGPARQLLVDPRARTRSRPATSTSTSTPKSTTSTRSTAPTGTAASSAGRPAAAANAPTFNLADFLVGARNTYELVNPFVFELRQRMHFGYLQDDWGSRRT